MRQVSDLTAYAGGVAHDVEPVDVAGAGIWIEQCPKDPQHRALPAAVRSQQRHGFTAAHLERNSAQHPSRAESLAKTDDIDRMIGLAVGHQMKAWAEVTCGPERDRNNRI